MSDLGTLLLALALALLTFALCGAVAAWLTGEARR